MRLCATSVPSVQSIMEALQAQLPKINVPTENSAIYKDECAYSFHTQVRLLNDEQRLVNQRIKLPGTFSNVESALLGVRRRSVHRFELVRGLFSSIRAFELPAHGQCSLPQYFQEARAEETRTYRKEVASRSRGAESEPSWLVRTSTHHFASVQAPSRPIILILAERD